MKALISPPLNLLLTLLGLLLFGWLVLNIMTLKLMSVDNQATDNYTKIEIPSSEVLSVPPLRQYQVMLDSPLFWESREKIAPPKPKVQAAKPQISLADKKLPEGRLIGIIDTGESMMAVFKDAENSHYLHVNDKWGSWKVASIGHDSIELALGTEKQQLDLINDYVAPAANKNRLAQKRLKKTKRKNNKLAESRRRPNLPENVRRLPHLASTQKQAPPIAVPAEMSIKEALAARQRLMAARWKKKDH